MAWGGKFDALTIHPYRGEMNDLGFIRELQDVRKLVDGRDVWLTEMGFPSQLIDGWSERRQASLCARVYLCTLASGAGRNVSWYDFRNDGIDPFYHEMNFGLVRNDLRLKPGYGTLATLGRTIGHMQVREQIDMGADQYAFRFSDGRRDVVALCAADRAGLASFKAAGAPAVTNAFGESLAPDPTGDVLTVTLDAGFPVYVSGPANFPFERSSAPVAYRFEPRSVSAGGTVSILIDAKEHPESVDWDLPQGWPQPRSTGPGRWALVVPDTAAAYQYDVQAVMRRSGGVLRLPARISVAPAVIRL